MNQAMRDAEQDESYYTPPELVYVLQRYIKNRWPFMVKSAPGCGKSDIIEQVAYVMGYDLIITHPVIDDPIDYKGMPAVVGGGAKGTCKEIDGELHFSFRLIPSRIRRCSYLMRTWKGSSKRPSPQSILWMTLARQPPPYKNRVCSYCWHGS